MANSSLFKQQPSFLHPNRNQANVRLKNPLLIDYGYRVVNFSFAPFVRLSFCIAVHKKYVAGIEIHSFDDPVG